ncbi:PREDICTED: centromere protein F-like [Poecilia mexicana]|uniref:centromere protein F-like n=1 Tax=Poecilia mexicana TaxID=48701 RepID=UPI00072E9601|nr:PREDICTED: centromere protein F-like [Poecilia mexicana]
MSLVSEGGRSSEELQVEATQLRSEAEVRRKEVEELKTALEKKTAEAEERRQELKQKEGEVKERAAALEGVRAEKERELEEIRKELDEVNALLEEKSTEADESMEKYCSLMVKVHKLEESNDALKTRLEQLAASQPANEAKAPPETHRRSARKSSSRLQDEKMSENTENVVPTTTASPPQGSSPGKRGHKEISDRDGAQEALHNLTKKLKANTATPRGRGEQDDEEFRPEGLPDLVQKGFADIPLGEASPYIIRRTTGRRCSPRLAARQTQPDVKVLVPVHLQSPSGLSSEGSDGTRQPLRGEQKAWLNVHQDAEQREKHVLVEQTKQAENCHVQ